MLMELSGNRRRRSRPKQLLTDASQLAGVEQEMSRTENRDRRPQAPAV